MTITITSFLKLQPGFSESVIESLKQIPEVVKILTISGEFDILVEITSPVSENFATIFSEKIDHLPGIIEIHSHLVMKAWEK